MCIDKYIKKSLTFDEKQLQVWDFLKESPALCNEKSRMKNYDNHLRLSV